MGSAAEEHPKARVRSRKPCMASMSEVIYGKSWRSVEKEIEILRTVTVSLYEHIYEQSSFD